MWLEMALPPFRLRGRDRVPFFSRCGIVSEIGIDTKILYGDTREHGSVQPSANLSLLTFMASTDRRLRQLRMDSEP